MALDASKFSVREGLIRIVDAERFQPKPQAGENVTVIIMKKSGDVLRYYGIFTSGQDQFSIGEKIWGNFVCYVVDRSVRKLVVEDDFATNDKITTVHVKADISYQVLDPKLVAIGVDDALLSLKDELTTIIKREVSQLSIDQVLENRLEIVLTRQDSSMRSLLGICIIKSSVSLEWAKEILERLRNKRNRQYEKEIENEDISRKRELEMGDIEHVDQILAKLGLNSLPADARLKLLSMPRERAYEEIVGYIQQQRGLMQQTFLDRSKQEYDLLQKMIDRGILEDFDLQDFGKNLLDRYSHMISMNEVFGVSPSLMLGSSPKPALNSGDEKKGEKKKKEETPKDDDETSQSGG
jgi:hypothetical protein